MSEVLDALYQQRIRDDGCDGVKVSGLQLSEVAISRCGGRRDEAVARTGMITNVPRCTNSDSKMHVPNQ